MINNLDLTFLTKEQVENLGILKNDGIRVAITDFSLLLGVETFLFNNQICLWWWTKTSNNSNYACTCDIDRINGFDWEAITRRNGGIRPAIKYSSIKNMVQNEKKVNGIKEVEFGEYPQTIVSKDESDELDKLYSINALLITGKNYTTDSYHYLQIGPSFSARTHTEYEYNGSKYIRFVADLNCKEKFLSDGRKLEINKPYWVKVEPVIWLVDENDDIALCEKVIASGLQFDNKDIYYGEFSKTNIKWFMDTYLSKDLIYDLNVDLSLTKPKVEENKMLNPYGFEFSKPSDEDMLKGSIESGVAVYLHGLSGDGKSARVKEYDKDAEIIYLLNSTPEAIIGKSVYKESTGEMIDIKPTWLVNLEEKCKREPDRLHVLFFDEISNAPKSVQGLAFNIILDREVNGKWRLPDNARVVAAGNEVEESIAANKIAKPLYDRFAHIYIKTTVDSWLKWASKNNIHPAIYSFIAYKGESVLRTKYDGKKPNADPRKWEMASKVLYQTKNPNMLTSLVGEEITNEFIMFCKQRVITLADVLNNNYEKEKVEQLNLAEKYATIMNLSQVDEENLECVRDFVSLMGREFLATFDSLWVHGDKERLEIIADLKSGNKLVRGK